MNDDNTNTTSRFMGKKTSKIISIKTLSKSGIRIIKFLSFDSITSNLTIKSENND